MKVPRICPRGHQWESNETPASCPVCAAGSTFDDQAPDSLEVASPRRCFPTRRRWKPGGGPITPGSSAVMPTWPSSSNRS